MSYYHGKVIGPDGQIYQCEHNHRTFTAAVTCSNSSATRRMAAMAFNQKAAQAAQAAALAKKRAEERAAAEARRIAAEKAAAVRRATAQAAAERAKAAKRAAKLAAMSPRRAWKRMTPEERLLSTAEVELEAFGEIVSPDAKAVYDARASKRATLNAQESLEATRTAEPDRPTAPVRSRPSIPPTTSVAAVEPPLDGPGPRPEQERERRLAALFAVACPDCRAQPPIPCVMGIGIPVALVRKYPVAFCHYSRMRAAVATGTASREDVKAQFGGQLPKGLDL